MRLTWGRITIIRVQIQAQAEKETRGFVFKTKLVHEIEGLNKIQYHETNWTHPRDTSLILIPQYARKIGLLVLIHCSIRDHIAEKQLEMILN